MKAPALDWNAVRFDPAAGKDHVESYFLKANDPASERAVWIKATIFASAREPERAVAEGWAIAFDRRGGRRRHAAVKHVVPYGEASFSRHDLAISWRAEPPRGGTAPAPRERGAPSGAEGLDVPLGLELRAGRTRGAIALRDHAIRWDLAFAGDDRPLVLLPSLAMYTSPIPKSKLVTPYPDARFDGVVEVDGERWTLDGWRGMQGHNWGRGHAELYAWCHANLWEEDKELVLEGVSARVRIGPVLTPLTTIVCVRHRGVSYPWNAPLDVYRAKGDVTPRHWTFAAEGKAGRIEGVVEADAGDMVGLYYPNPDGPMTYCLNSKLARARVRFEPAGRPPLTLTTRAAALEIGTRSEDHGVAMHV